MDLEGPGLASRYPEWARTSINSPESAQQAYEFVRESAEKLPDVRHRLFADLDEVGLSHPETVSDWSALLRWLSDVAQFQERFTPEVYDLSHADLIAALAPVNRWWKRIATILSTGYRKARQSVQATLRTAASLSGHGVLQTVGDAAGQLVKWRELAGDGAYPRVPERLSDTLAALDPLIESLKCADGIFSENMLEQPHARLEELLNHLASQQSVATRLPRVRDLERGFADAGVDGIIALVGSEIPLEHAADAVERTGLRQCGMIWPSTTRTLPASPALLTAVAKRSLSISTGSILALPRKGSGGRPPRLPWWQ